MNVTDVYDDAKDLKRHADCIRLWATDASPHEDGPDDHALWHLRWAERELRDLKESLGLDPNEALDPPVGPRPEPTHEGRP